MKIFVVGGLVPEPTDKNPSQLDLLRTTAAEIGGDVARARHTLVVCSPFDGSADIEALRGFAASAASDKVALGDAVEIHYPDDIDIGTRIVAALERLNLGDARLFRHPPVRTQEGVIDRSYSWLLAQLAALDRCHTVVAIGGNPAGSSSMLLHLAEARRIPILPLPDLGGAAAESLERHRYELMDRLGDRFSELNDKGQTRSVVSLIEILAQGALGKRKPNKPVRFFISYARDRPEEADFVEMTLRRRNCEVFRDEHSFPAGGHLPSEVRDNIHRADIFVALWCQQYACSPWCHDELELALDRHDNGHLGVLILSVDKTRIVPPRARSLIGYTCLNRVELEGRLREQIEQIGSD